MKQQYVNVTEKFRDDVLAAADSQGVMVFSNMDICRKIISSGPYLENLKLAVRERVPVMFNGMVVTLDIVGGMTSIERVQKEKKKVADRKTSEAALCKNLVGLISSFKIPLGGRHSSLKGYYSEICKAYKKEPAKVEKHLASVDNLKTYSLFAKNELYNPNSEFYLSALQNIYPDAQRFISHIPKGVYEILLTKLDVLFVSDNYEDFKKFIATMFYSCDITGIDTSSLSLGNSVQEENFCRYASSLGLKLFDEVKIEELTI